MNTVFVPQGPGTWLAIEVHFRCCHHEWICHIVTCSPAHCAIAAEALLLAKGFQADGPIMDPSLDLPEPEICGLGSCETATAKTFLYWAVSLSLVEGVISGRCAKACCESGRKAKEVEVTRLSAMARVLEYVLHTLSLSQTHQFESWSWSFWTSLSYWYKGMTYDILWL